MKVRVVLLSIFCIACIGVLPFLSFENTAKESQKSAVIISLGHISQLRGAGGFLTRRALEFNKQYPEVYIMVKSVSLSQIQESDAFDMISFLSLETVRDKLLPYSGGLNVSSESLVGGSSGRSVYGVPWIKLGDDIQYLGIMNAKKQAYATAFIEYVTGDFSQAKLEEIKAERVT